LIRNTPYGKRIQNKLQREQMDHFNGYQSSAVTNHLTLGNGLGNTHTTSRHVVPSHHQLTDVYGGQNGIYSLTQVQPSFPQNHLPASPIHTLQAQSIDGYVLHGNSAHTQGISASHPLGGGFSNASFAFTNGGGISDPYQRTFGYGM